MQLRPLREPLVRFGLLAPAAIFMLALFLWPILGMLSKGVYSPEVETALPLTSAEMARWTSGAMPPPSAFDALVTDLSGADRRAVAEAGRRLNYEVSGYRTLIVKTAGRIQKAEGASSLDKLVSIDKDWARPEIWGAMRRAAPSLTASYLLAAVDLEKKDDGSIGAVAPDRAIFLDVLLRSLWISGVVTLVCLVLAFPVAYRIATASARWRGLLLLLVLLPFWTSLLVRTSAWVVLLQDNGLINSFLISSGLIREPLHLIFNRTGVYISFIHVMLPFMVLPLYSVMIGISKDYTRAAYSLGAGGLRTFFKVYLPLVWPGAFSGCLLTFVICVGYYVTPLLVGGNRDQMLSYFIAFYTKQTVNWGLASALAILLSLCVFAILGIYALFGRRKRFAVKV